jgi:Flp pilus assembly protein TadB
MTLQSLKENLEHMKEIVRELYVFTNQLDQIKNLETGSSVIINGEEKRLLGDAITALTNQLRILNNSIPGLIKSMRLYKKIGRKESISESELIKGRGLVQVKYNHERKPEGVLLTISEEDREDFLKNLGKSNLSINQLKKKFSVHKPAPEFGKPNLFAKISNRFFRNISNRFISNGYFSRLNSNLRKINSPFVLGTYVSMILMAGLITFLLSFIFFIFLLFFDIGISFPFLTLSDTPFVFRIVKRIWILFVIPIVTILFVYFYPSSESKNLGEKINQELPFVAIHMSAVATSGVEPISIFKIILKSEEYRYTNVEFRKLMNLLNFHGKDLVSALRHTARSCPSSKLKVLLEGLATSITSGGLLDQFLEKHSETLLFDYKLEREKYTNASETFMDIYISIVIAAPMIFLMLFVIMGSTGALGGFLGLSVGILSLLIILGIIFLNIGFLIFLNIKQPVI